MHRYAVSLRGRRRHSDQATQGLHGTEELGDEARQAGRWLAKSPHHARMLADDMSFRNVAAVWVEVADDDTKS
jgi:hypothetical protein